MFLVSWSYFDQDFTSLFEEAEDRGEMRNQWHNLDSSFVNHLFPTSFGFVIFKYNPSLEAQIQASSLSTST